MKTETYILLAVIIIFTALGGIVGWHVKPKVVETVAVNQADTPIETVAVNQADTPIETIEEPINKKIYIEKPAETIHTNQDTIYHQLIDSTIVQGEDSLGFVADIFFSTKEKKFTNDFDFTFRVKEKIKEVIKYYAVERPADIEIYQEPLVIILGLIATFFIGLAL